MYNGLNIRQDGFEAQWYSTGKIVQDLEQALWKAFSSRNIVAAIQKLSNNSANSTSLVQTGLLHIE